MTTQTLEKELQKKLQESPRKKGEDEQVYLKRLIEAADELDDDKFGSLSKEAQEWCESAAQAVLANKPIPPPLEEEEGEGDEVNDDSGDRTVKKTTKSAKSDNGKAPAKPKSNVKAKAPSKPAVKADTRVARARGSLPTGRNKFIQEILAKDPNASIETIIKELEKKNVPVPSKINISTSRSAFRSALETLNRLNMLKTPVNLGR